jgi:peptidyl-prolyl cis-trans isomerase SurA
LTPIRRGMRGGVGRIVIIAAACIFAAIATPSRAFAQHVVLVINGEIITDYDIEQRTKFDTLSTHKTPTRQEVIEQLIDDKLKVQIARRYKLDITDADVESSYADMAKRMHLTADQLTQTLAHDGVDAKTLKARVRADLSWQYIIRGKFQSSLQISEKSVIDEIATTEKKSDGGDVGYDYTLRPILFVVPRGNTALQESRRKDAEALRSRFSTCDTGLLFARALHDVVIREPITKNSSDLIPALREILDKTEVGHLTPPETTQQGIELFALCEKKETKFETPEKRQAREKLFSEQFEAKAKKYLRELRQQAMIERK